MHAVHFDVRCGGLTNLGSQHSSVWGGLVTVSLDLHSTGNTADGFATTVFVSLR